MLTYFCKYTPLELLAGYHISVREPNQEAPDFAPAEELIHSSVCSHARLLVMDYLHEKRQIEKQEMILTSCCDSVRRVYDSLPQEDFSLRVMLDLPHKNEDYAVSMYARSLCRLKGRLAAHCGNEFDRAAFLDAWQKNASAFRQFMDEDYPCAAVLGARASDELFQKIRGTFLKPGSDMDIVNFTCGGLRSLPLPPENAGALEEEGLMNAYARALLTQIPCMRMEDVSGRVRLLRRRNLRAIIYHSVRFCDYYSAEYAEICRHSDVPVLKIESDYTFQGSGQLATRLEAFAESLRMKEGNAAGGQGQNPQGDANVQDTEAAGTKQGPYLREDSGPRGTNAAGPAGSAAVRPERSPDGGKAMNAKKIYMGIDSGSTTTNVAAIDEEGKLLAWAIVRTGAKAGLSAQKACEQVKAKLGEDGNHIARIVATGYGRANIAIADDSVTEISCHARGAHYADPEARCVIDIGGQDSKVICLDEGGNVVHFVMNDKCAAGTGRFLEMMARTLEMDLDQMGRAGLTFTRDLTITSTCTVFAESEVVSFIAENIDTNDIVHALDVSVASKTVSMVRRIHGEGPFMMTGGVAKNQGVVRQIEHLLGAPLSIMPHPDLIGALGAALFARG